MKDLICIFLTETFDWYDRILNSETIDNDSTDSLLARQYWQEIDSCKRNNVPWMIMVDDVDILPRGEGLGQVRHDFFTLYDCHKNKINNLNNCRVFLRSTLINTIRALEILHDNYGANLIVKPKDIVDTIQWVKVISRKFLKRKLLRINSKDLYKIEGGKVIINQKLIEFVERDKLFIKTEEKLNHDIVKGSKLISILPNYSYNFISSSSEENRELYIIVSDILDLVKDKKCKYGNLEFRAFVINSRISSISKAQLDEEKSIIPRNISVFALDFVKENKKNLPKHYVFDIALDKKKGPILIELNEICASGRLSNNSFDKIIVDLKNQE